MLPHVSSQIKDATETHYLINECRNAKDQFSNLAKRASPVPYNSGGTGIFFEVVNLTLPATSRAIQALPPAAATNEGGRATLAITAGLLIFGSCFNQKPILIVAV